MPDLIVSGVQIWSVDTYNSYRGIDGRAALWGGLSPFLQTIDGKPSSTTNEWRESRQKESVMRKAAQQTGFNETTHYTPSKLVIAIALAQLGQGKPDDGLIETAAAKIVSRFPCIGSKSQGLKDECSSCQYATPCSEALNFNKQGAFSGAFGESEMTESDADQYLNDSFAAIPPGSEQSEKSAEVTQESITTGGKAKKKSLADLPDNSTTHEVLPTATAGTEAFPEPTVAATIAHEIPKREVAKPASTYAFPSSSRTFVSRLEKARLQPRSELIAELAALTGTSMAAIKDADQYPELREITCAIMVLMNERQIAPPIIRDSFASPRTSRGLSDEQKTLINDRQVLDMHWLHCNGYRAIGGKWKAIFGDVFNFDLASNFVVQVGTLENKAGELGLTRQDMLLLKTLRTEAVRKRQDDIRSLLGKARESIRRAYSDPQCRQTCTLLEMIDSCHALLLADLNPKSAATVLQQSGEYEVSAQTLNRRCKWLLERDIIFPIGSS